MPRSSALPIRPGPARISEIGRPVEGETPRRGFQVMRQLCGHGVGRAIHEPPNVPNFHDPQYRARLTEAW